MFSRVLSAAICGIQGLPIFVEADVSQGLPGFSMVGDLSAKVKEAQDRVMTAFRNSGIQLRPKRITVNLSPADIHKDGSSYDLPVALAILAAYQLLPMETLKGVLVAGELGLNGAVKGIKGALPIVQLAKKNGCHTCILPERNRTEGEMVSDIHIVGVSTLKEVLHYLQKGTIPGKIKKDVYNIEETEKNAEEICRYLPLKKEKITGSCDILKRILSGDYDEYFIVLNPGDAVTEQMYRFNGR